MQCTMSRFHKHGWFVANSILCLICRIGSSSSAFIKLMCETQFWRQQHIKHESSYSAWLKPQVASILASYFYVPQYFNTCSAIQHSIFTRGNVFKQSKKILPNNVVTENEMNGTELCLVVLTALTYIL